jgi:hypothetical protein
MTRDPVGEGRRPSRRIIIGCSAVVIVVLAGLGTLLALEGRSSPGPSHRLATSDNTPETTVASTTTTAPFSTTSTPPLPKPAGPGFVPGKVTAVGDSVMLDYQDELRASIPGVDVDASVSRQWSDGESLLTAMKAQGQLGADVIVGLGTNRPITQADFDNMMSILGGASRVVFVNTHVDRPWQDPNNAILAQGAARYPNVLVADWATLAAQNPQWFGSDGTHLGVDGPGANALAALVATTLANG